jgi:hypothetical protein
MRTAAQGQARTVSVGRVLELPLGLIAMATITVMEGMAGGHGSTGHHSATGVSALAAVLLVVVSVIAASVIVDWRRNQGGRHSAAARGCMFCALGSMLVSVAL